MFLSTEPELLESILGEIKGFGGKRIQAVINILPTLDELLNTVLNMTPEQLREKLSRVITIRNATDLCDAIKELVNTGWLIPGAPFELNRKKWIDFLIKKEFRDIAEKKFEIIEQINIDDLDFNPFLLRLLRLESPQDIAEFMVAERLERGLVTSFGQRIQTIIKMFASGTGVEGADICKERDGRRHYIQIKAGPNTINKDITNEINKLLSSAIRRNGGSIPLLGMTYGKRERVNSIIQRYSQVNWLIGAEFWEFISEDPECAHRIFEIAGEASSEVPEGEKPFHERYRDKITELANQIRKKYGEGPGIWERLFSDNM